MAKMAFCFLSRRLAAGPAVGTALAAFGVALALGFALAVGLVPVGARAQTQNELRAVLERMNRLEGDINQLQRQVYRGEAPPAQAGGGGGGGGNETALAQISVRLDQFDEVVRNLTGRVEELGHKVAETNARLEKFMADADYRFGVLEKGGALEKGANPAAPQDRQGASGAPAPLSPAAPATAAPPQEAAPTRGPPPRALGTIPANTPLPRASAPAPQAGNQAPPPAGATAAAGLPPGSAQEQYNYATQLLRKGDYAQAEDALSEFLGAHPEDPLAAAAQYWLGETFFVRQQYDKAASAFLKGYQKYPKSNKAPDNLLKLGMSLGNLNQKQEACATFAQLASQFPHADVRIKQALTRQRAHTGCQ